MPGNPQSLEDRIKVESGDLVEVPRADKNLHSFRINDVDLVVPPTDITIQKEDLIHQWRTLRSNASTKIPSGQGQIAVSVIIAFTGGQILDMHRLLVEFRHSPFCYIENRFLRESVVPHWPGTQNMAFTMTGLSIAPMQGSSDTWIMQLDLTWFNYAPYLHNWFYRLDWHTVPVRAEGELEEQEPVEITIGWDWDGERKIPRHTILPGLFGEDSEIRTWNVVSNKYNDREVLSIEQMQELHRGEIFDLQPLPNRMQPAAMVSRPDQSRIYTRYINYLQRDALKRNFGIDVEGDLRTPDGKPTAVSSAMFSAVLEGERRRTFSLHSGPPRDSSIYRAWRAAADKWITNINSYHGGVVFSFAAYNELRLPAEYAEAIQRAHADSIENAKNDLGLKNEFAPEWVDHFDYDGMVNMRREPRVFARSLVRRGWTDPNGKYVPIGPLGSLVPYDVDKVPLPDLSIGQTAHVSYRGPDTAKRLYGSESLHRMHVGTDFPTQIGQPVFAVADGYVAKANNHKTSDDGIFKLMQLDDDDWAPLFDAVYAEAPVPNTNSPRDQESSGPNDFERSLRAHVPGVKFHGPGNVIETDAGYWPVGTAVPSIDIPGAYYVVMPTPGGKGITLSHSDDELSIYSHLSEVLVSQGERVDAGQLIGYTGNTGPFKEEFLKQALDSVQSPVLPHQGGLSQIVPTDEKFLTEGSEEPTSIWKRSAHLHFEYWERLDKDGARDPEYPADEIPRYYHPDKETLCPVDPINSFKLAISGSPVIQVNPVLLRPDDEDVANYLTDELGEDTAGALMETLSALWDDGWMYYDHEASVTNVWWKQFHVNAQRQVGELNENSLKFNPLVLTAVAGGLRHVVANIPILGHEFPTQQHLGSIEPFYSFEFCSLDNLGNGPEYLAGLPKEAQLLLSMRDLLHSNARNFRPVVDSWTVAGDSFVTRLLGSYRHEDVLWKPGEEVVEDPLSGPRKVASDTKLLRRLINTRGTSQTVKGQPGLSCHSLEFQETNPYVGEFISSTAPAAIELEEAYCQILKKLYEWDFDDKYKDVLTQILIAQLAGSQTTNPGDPDYGQYELQYIGANQLDDIDGVALYSDGASEYVVFGDSDPALAKLLQAAQSGVVRMPGTAILGVPAAILGQPINITQTTDLGRQAVPGLLPGAGGISWDATETVINYRYDISKLLNQTQSNQLSAEIPLAKILDYWALVHETIVSAEMMLAENQLQVANQTGRVEPGGISEETAYQELYCLPVRPSLFKYFQEWLKIAAEELAVDLDIRRIPPGQATWQLENNINWIYWENPLEPHQLGRVKPSNAQKAFAIAEAAGHGVLKTLDVQFTAITAVLGFGEHHGIRTLLGEDPSQIEGHFSSFVESQYDLTATQVAKNYLWNLPLRELAVQERFKSYVTENIFGDITGTLVGRDGSPVFENLVDQLKTVVSSCGYWIPSAHPGANPWFFVGDTIKTRTNDDSYLLEGGHLTPDVDAKGRVEVPTWNPASGTAAHFLANGAKGIYSWNDPFIWRVNPEGEQSKLNFFKGVLARYAENIRQDFSFLRAFGLSGLGNISSQARITGAPAYPDLDLPHHPYYGVSTSTSPDFYMWNIYEDAGASDPDTVDAMYEAMYSIVENCYRSMKGLEEGSAHKDKIVLEPGTEDKIIIPQGYRAEGTDSSDRGPTDFPYAPNPDAATSRVKYFEELYSEVEKSETQTQDLSKKAAKLATATATPVAGDLVETLVSPSITRDQIDALGSTQILDFRMSLGENFNGVGGGVQYPRRMPAEKYEELKTTAAGIKQMFGSRAGYTLEKDFPDDVTNSTKGTVIERDTDPSHRFNIESIKALAKASAKDITSQKRTMRRAYPTFKLFFVEEDEFESRLLNFDDFFSYNGVTSFTVVQSRKSPADHAVITLLNVGGSLDGTKRDAIVDLDYYSAEFSKTKIPGEGSKTGGDTNTQGTALDQPFGAVVLRPGLNVQLRVGYSNDPDELQVLISGRVADIQWNASGDRAELMVQSFGTELMQAIKGSSHTDDAPTYPTTHHLLGAMMLEPELAHFGRWEFGQIYQHGEGSDATLDFNDYSRDAFLGRFKASNAAMEWMLEHPVITGALIIGGGVILSKAPGSGRLFRGVANKTSTGGWTHRLLSRLGITGSAPGQQLWLKQLVDVARTRAPGSVFNAGKGTLTAADIAAVSAQNAGQRAVTFSLLREISKRAFEAGATKNPQTIIARARIILRTATKKALEPGLPPGRVASIMARADAEVIALAHRGQWMTKPASFSFSKNFLLNVGGQPIRNLGRGFIRTVPQGIAAASGFALGADALLYVLGPQVQPHIDRVRAYFRSKKASMFLSPQDDNLYPPHPKDYMEIYDAGYKEMLKQLGAWTIRTGISAFTYSDELGYGAARWALGYDALDKRVDPSLCEFSVTGQTIWDVFHEMSLRHPGWIYGVRPYGNKFRYTMFFGVPSQRYWARPAHNQFVSRANDLARLLTSRGDDPDITIDEYLRLYGGDFGEDQSMEAVTENLLLDAADAAIAENYRISGRNTGDGGEFFVRQAAIGQGSSALHTIGTDGELHRTYENVDTVVMDSDIPIEESRFYKAAINSTLSSRAIKEYMTALELRFEPFRRYHSLTSDHDIVWNGLISSENAVYNAVDVTYFGEDFSDGPAGSQLFKAHTFIPEHKLRVLPLEPSYNVRGYGMAMRYGMGALLHTMRDMYRGEIISLGNARIRPWDICILADSYNDMVGPVEVEQVVHSFSHETGFITEIKPGAVVLANETSSWPVLEAMKMMSLATKDVEDSFQGLRLGDAGSLAHALDWLLNKGTGGSEEYKEHLAERVEALSPFDAFGLEDGTSDAQDIEEIGEVLGFRSKANTAAVWVTAGASIAASAAAFKAAPLLVRAVPQLGTGFTRMTAATTTGLVLFGGSAALMGMAGSATPSLQWLLGGPVLFLSCLRGDSIMMIPLMKNGHPIVSGLNLSDPSMIWNNFKGDLGRWADDHISGTRDLSAIWRLYGTNSWRRFNTNTAAPDGSYYDDSQTAYAELTGEER